MALIAAAASYVYDEGTSYANPGVSGVDVVVERGRLLVVLGPTGSGKSTLLKLLAGLLPPTGGSVLADAAPLVGRGQAPRGTVGLVFQDPESQLFAETVAEDVAFGPSNLGANAEEAKVRAAEALGTVGLDAAEFGPRSPFGLSGGEARRVAIAGVLAMRPPYLLLDEPTAGLDAGGREAVCGAVTRAKATAGAVVVTHDAEQFLPMADDVLVLADGRPIFNGSAESLISSPAVLDKAGLAVPEVLRAQLLAVSAGAVLASWSADEREAAARLAAAAGWGR